MRAARDGGFSLIEVLVAFAILAAALATLSSAFGTGLRGTRTADLQLRAVDFAENLLAEAGRSAPLERGVQTGTADGLHWQLEVAPWQDNIADATPPAAGAALDALRVSVRVGWGSRPGQSVNLQTLRVIPRPRARAQR